MSQPVYATSPNGELAIIEFKPTGSESVVIENISPSSLNLQNYILEYFNKSNPSNFSIPTSSQQLPSFTLSPGQSFLLTGDSVGTCGASGVANLSLSLSDTSGYLEIVKTSGIGGNISYTQQDKVSWTSAGSGADINSVPSASSDANAVWYRKLSDGSWNKYGIDSTPCNLFVTISASSGPTYVSWAAGDQAPSQIIIADTTSSIPAIDQGLAPPQITEIFPNPAPPQSDDEDEFIELYNPNDSFFDLSGFRLEVGITTLHSYTLPANTTVPAKSFKAFYSIDTNLAMSNTSGLVKLIDPLGTVISQTEQYGSAKEGQSWSLVQGKWYWASPSPGVANSTALNTSPAQSSTAQSPNSNTLGTNIQSSNTPSPSKATSNQPTKVHGWTIAVIGSAALLYALYEYRADIQNRLYQFRRYREDRRNSSRPNKHTFVNRIKGRSWWRKNDVSKRHSSRPKKPLKRK